jgi:hypothetical protein
MFPSDTSIPPALIAIGAAGVSAKIWNVSIYRDIHYLPPGGVTEWQLGPDEFLVLGDNCPLSDETRLGAEGPIVHRNLILGKVFRWPGRPTTFAIQDTYPATNQEGKISSLATNE